MSMTADGLAYGLPPDEAAYGTSLTMFERGGSLSEPSADVSEALADIIIPTSLSALHCRVPNRGLGTGNLDLANSKENYLPFHRRESGLKMTHDYGKPTPARFLQNSHHQPNALQGPTNRFLSSFPSMTLFLEHLFLLFLSCQQAKKLHA